MPTPAKDVRTHWEAGVALVYGEIGELLTRLERLRDEIPRVVEAGTRDLNTSIIAVVKATKGAQAVIAGYGDSQEQRLTTAGTREREQLRGALHQVIDDVARSAAKSVELLPRKRKTRWLLLLAAAIGLALAGAGGAYVGATLAMKAHEARRIDVARGAP
jgi:hypothetical protein